MKIPILPAIDLRGGYIVRLEQGRAEAQTVYGSDPVAVARDFLAAGATSLHMVDLDGAFSGTLANLSLVESVTKNVPGLFVELGGGLRDEATIEQALAAGVHRVVIGTKACESLPFVRTIIDKFGADKIAIGIDAKNGIVSTKGWTTPSTWNAPKLAQAVAAEGVKTLIYTDIATDGMFTGPNLPALEELAGAVPGVGLIASGGVASVQHIQSLRKLHQQTGQIHGIIIGKALYDGKIQLADALAAAEL